MIKYSIISAYVNEVELTHKFLDNLEGKLPENTEVILVNAGNKERIEHSFKDETQFKRIDLNENISFANSMNVGIKEAKGEYRVIIGNDGFPTDEQWIVKLESCFKDKGCMIATCDNTSPGKKSILGKVYETKYNHEYYHYFPAICWMLSINTINKVGYFDEGFKVGGYEDNDYCARVSLEGGKIILNTSVFPLVHKCSSESNNLLNKNIKENNLKYFVKKYMGE